MVSLVIPGDEPRQEYTGHEVVGRPHGADREGNGVYGPPQPALGRHDQAELRRPSHAGHRKELGSHRLGVEYVM